MRLKWMCLLIATAACSSSDEPCVIPPCALPAAMNVTLTSKATGAPVTGTIELSGAETSSPIPCQGMCYLPGYSGTYHLKVSAAGFVTNESDVTVTGSVPAKCGCQTVDTKSVAIVLTPVG